MILWKKYKGKPHNKAILDKVGAIPRSNMSNTFLVMGGFDTDKELEPRMAYILIHGTNQYQLMIFGLQGNIRITHWTHLNKPSR